MEGVRANPPEPKLDPPLLIETSMYSGTGILAASYMNMQLVCTSKNIWTELSYEFGPSVCVCVWCVCVCPMCGSCILAQAFWLHPT